MAITGAPLSDLAREVHDRRRLSPAARVAIRQAAGLSQQRLADALGIHRVTIARYELDLRQPSGELGRRYLALLDELQDVLNDEVPADHGRPAGDSTVAAGPASDATRTA